MKLEIDLSNRASLLKLQADLRTALATVETAMRGFQEQGSSFITASKRGDEMDVFSLLPNRFTIGDVRGNGVPKWKAKLLLKEWVIENKIRVFKAGKPGVATIYEKI